MPGRRTPPCQTRCGKRCQPFISPASHRGRLREREAHHEIYDLINHVLNDEVESSEHLQNRLLPLFDLLFKEPSPGPVKYLLTQTWEDVGSPLMPITDISSELANKLLDNFQKIKSN